MLKTVLLLLCSVAILVSGADDAATSSSNTETPISETDGTTKNPITSSTATTPTTTPSSIITTVITSTSSVSTSTSTSTLAPTTASTPAPTPTPTPSPVLPPKTGKWIVNETSQTCIIAQMALQFNLTYITAENKTAHLVLDLPVSNQTVAQGKCGAKTDLEQNLTLTWKPTYIYTTLQTTQNNLTLHFVKNTTKNQYALHHLELFLAPEEFPNIRANYSPTFMHRSDLFTTALKNSYRCLRTQTLNLTDADNKNKTGEFTVSDLQFQAFHVEDTSNFGFAEDCAFDTPDIVPIAVGCALATLVVFVLIAYLAARRHSQARGYLSM